ncbi:hypothetical protein D3C81_2060030 [compost metagenome]
MAVGGYLPWSIKSTIRPGRNSQLSRLLHLLTDDAGRQGINEALQWLHQELRSHAPILNTQTSITNRHDAMLGNQPRWLAVALSIP